MSSRLLVLCGLLAASALAYAAGAFAGDGGLTPAGPHSPNAARAEDIYYLIAAFAGLVFLLVAAPLILFVVRFRSRGRAREVEGPQIRGNTKLELAWTALPVVILVIVAGFVFYKLPGITDLAEAGDDVLRVKVEGRQFYWQYEYPNGVIGIDRLRAPLGRVVELEITAPLEDVNHSFWVAPLGGKFDSIPGQTTVTSFRADKVGVYEGQCGEFCGVRHAQMLAAIEVVPRAEFERWLDEQARAQEAGDSDLGEITYEGACAKCHGFEAEGLIGPTLAGNSLLNDREGLETIVRNGRGAMPAIGEEWEERQMDALFAYVQEEFAPETPGTDGG